MRTHPFTAKIGIWNRNPENVKAAIERQLNAGHVGVSMEAVESAQEVRDVIKAMRLDVGRRHASGDRPREGRGLLGPVGRRVQEEGRHLAAQQERRAPHQRDHREPRRASRRRARSPPSPASAQIFAGYGTLGGVFKGDPEGRENAGARRSWRRARSSKSRADSPPTTRPRCEQRMKEGWSVFIMQRRDENAFAAVETGRTLGSR